MTIGFAATHLDEQHAAFAVAADSRYSFAEGHSDAAVKTYALGPRTGLVTAGNALSCSAAADLTRGLVDDQERLTPERPVDFYSVVRHFAHFLDITERANPWGKGSDVALAGFLRNGSPSVARVISRPGGNTEVFIYAPVRRGSLIVMVGQQEGKEQLWSALGRAFGEGMHQWFARLAGTIHYLCKHEGEPTVGGAPSLAVCAAGETLFWPFVAVDSRLYYRGVDVTDCDFRPEGRSLLDVKYDEGWHVSNDRERTAGAVQVDEGFVDLSCLVGDIIQPTNVFKWADRDPAVLQHTPDLQGPASVNVIVRPGDLSWFRSVADVDHLRS